MVTNLADPPAVVEPARSRNSRLATRSALTALLPVVVALAALAVHRFIPAGQPPPLNWLEALPAWQHPYPVLLAAIGLASLLVAAARFTSRSLRSYVDNFAPLIAGATAVLLVWEFVTVKMDWFHQPFFPGPDEVLGGMIEDRVLLLKSTWHSLQLVLSGYVIGVLGGLASGVLVGWFPGARYWAMPAIKFFGPIPATALIPLVMTLWQDSFPCAVALVAYAVWFPMTILTSSGIANVRLSYIDVARTLGAKPMFLIFRVAIPAALPTIFVGMFVGLGASFLTLIVAETVGVKAGLGWYLGMQRGYMEYAKVYGSLIICAVFFSTMMTILFKVRDRAVRWQKGVIKW